MELENALTAVSPALSSADDSFLESILQDPRDPHGARAIRCDFTEA